MRAADAPRTLRVASPRLLRQRRLARILELAGWRMLPGMAMGQGGTDARWCGHGAATGIARLAAPLTGAGALWICDGFLRSIQPAALGADALSLILDPLGSPHDPARASAIERMIEAGAGLDDALRARARAGAARLRELGLSSVSPLPRRARNLPRPGHVLVIDEALDDPVARAGGATRATFRAMLAAARAENAGARIVIAAPPSGTGHLTGLAPGGGEVVVEDTNTWDLIEGAARVYAVTALAGLHAALAGREVDLFGLPFYAGWGFTRDRLGCPRRTARRSADEVFAISHLLYPVHYDPFADRLTGFQETLETLAALAPRQQTRPGREVFVGFHRWKRRGVLRFRPAHARPTVFDASLARAARLAAGEGAQVWVWASRFEPEAIADLRRGGAAIGCVEDGFLRSVGLGARHIDAASLVFDPDGIYYDPATPSRLEALIAEAAGFAPDDPRLTRAARLRSAVVASRVTKYNLAAPGLPALEPGRRVVLVPGQVEDDASIRRGTSEVRTNRDLLARARAANPDAIVIYKPHPDVEAGLRRGRVPEDDARRLADHVAHRASADALMGAADEVWTMTSLMGFEALMRGKAVTTLGAPFYAGWGLTRDLGQPPARRQARPSLDALVWAALIAYPSYVDPRSGLPCEPELVIERLAGGTVPPLAPGAWLSARAQDAMAALGLVWWR